MFRAKERGARRPSRIEKRTSKPVLLDGLAQVQVALGLHGLEVVRLDGVAEHNRHNDTVDGHGLAEDNADEVARADARRNHTTAEDGSTYGAKRKGGGARVRTGAECVREACSVRAGPLCGLGNKYDTFAATACPPPNGV